MTLESREKPGGAVGAAKVGEVNDSRGAQVFKIAELIWLICQFLSDYDDIEAFLVGIDFSFVNCDRPEGWQKFLKKRLKNYWNRNYHTWGDNLINYFQYLRGYYWMKGKYPKEIIIVNDLKILTGELLRLHLKCNRRIQVINDLMHDKEEEARSQPVKHSTYCITSIQINKRQERELKNAHLGMCIHMSQVENLFVRQCNEEEGEEEEEKGGSGQPSTAWGYFSQMGLNTDGLKMDVLVRDIAKYDPEIQQQNRRQLRHAGCSLCDQRLAEKPTLGFSLGGLRKQYSWHENLSKVCTFYELTNELAPSTVATVAAEEPAQVNRVEHKEEKENKEEIKKEEVEDCQLQ